MTARRLWPRVDRSSGRISASPQHSRNTSRAETVDKRLPGGDFIFRPHEHGMPTPREIEIVMTELDQTFDPAIPRPGDSPSKRLYRWTLGLAEKPSAPWALGVIAFMESSFFPVPPDVILIPMSLARPSAPGSMR